MIENIIINDTKIINQISAQNGGETTNENTEGLS